MSKYIVILGNLDQGFLPYGPFDDEDAAYVWAEEVEHPIHWEVFELETPE